MRTSPGGKALNQAVALARLGAQVTAVGVVGDDGLGRDVVAALARERIDVSWLQVRGNAATSVCVCFVGDEGETSFVWHIDDEVAVTPGTVLAADLAIERADAVLMTFELPVSTICETVNLASRRGVRVIVQPAPPLADAAAVASLPWDKAGVSVPTRSKPPEARALLSVGQTDRHLPAEELASALACELSVPFVVVTLGESGCVAHTAGVTRRYPIQRTEAVDSTGASDAFTATFAAQLTAGAPETDAI